MGKRIHRVYMGVISIRLDAKELAYLKQHRLKPGPFVKEAAEQRLRHLRWLETLDELAKFRKENPPKPGPSGAEIIRQDRDSDHGRL